MSGQLGDREDFRTEHSLRDVHCTSLGDILEAVGSAKYSCGKTAVWASVYGPAAPRYMRLERYDRCTVEVEVVIMGESGARREKMEKEGKLFLQRILEQTIQLKLFPRLFLLIKVNILRNDGGMLAAALNACTLSLLNSNLPMYHVPIAVNCCRSEGGVLVLDPTLSEESTATASFLYVFASSHDLILFSSSCGVFSEKDLVTASALLRAAVPLFESEYKIAVKSKTTITEE